MRVNEFGTFGICLDEHSTDVFEGRLYVSVFEEPLVFKSLHDLINRMNKSLELAGVPHPFFEYRSFKDTPAVNRKPETGKDVHPKLWNHERYSGKIATFREPVLALTSHAR